MMAQEAASQIALRSCSEEVRREVSIYALMSVCRTPRALDLLPSPQWHTPQGRGNFLCLPVATDTRMGLDRWTKGL